MPDAHRRQPHRRTAAPPAGAGSRSFWPAIAIVGAALVAYHNSFANQFVFDDVSRIVSNPFIRRLWPPWLPLAETTRPVTQLTFALNYAVSGLEPWSYRLVNIAIHALAGLALLGIVRRTLESPIVGAPIRTSASRLALVAALVWTLHPLQTQAVTYAVQRAESLASLFYLLTLYCVIRGTGAPGRGGWHVAAVASCALGLASKPIVATAPLAVLIHDRMFLASSWREAWRARRGLYLALAGTLALLPFLAMNGRLEWQTSAGPGVAEVTPLRYAMTQAGVVLHYLRLAFWPHPLALDYGWPIVRTPAEAATPLLAIAALAALAVVLVGKGRRIGVPALWFFLILAPTSSVIPVADAAFEHRVYLALAGPVVIVTLALHRVLGAAARSLAWSAGTTRAVTVALVLGLTGALTALTIRRNADYRDGLSIWSDTVAKRPGNPRAQTNLGMALIGAGRGPEGLMRLEQALRVDSTYAMAHLALGFNLATDGRTDAALPHARAAVRLEPSHGESHFLLGAILLAEGRPDEAYPVLIEASRLEPTRSATHVNLGAILEARGDRDGALREYETAVRLKPDDPSARVALDRLVRGPGP